MATIPLGKRTIPETERQELRAIARRLVDGKTSKVAFTSFVPDLSLKLKTVLKEEFGFKGNIRILRTGETSRYDVLVKGGLRKVDRERSIISTPEPKRGRERPMEVTRAVREYKLPDTIEEALKGKDVYALSQAKGSLLLLMRSDKAPDASKSSAQAKLADVEKRLVEVGGGALTYKARTEEKKPSSEADELYEQKKQLRRIQRDYLPDDARYLDAQKKINLIDGRMSQLHADEYYKQHYQARPKQVSAEYPILNSSPAKVSARAPNKEPKKRGRKKQEVRLQLLENRGKNLPDIILTPKEADIYSNMQMLASRGAISRAELARVSGVQEKSLPSYLSKLRASGLPIPRERGGRIKSTVRVKQKMTRQDARRIIEEHGMPAQQLIEIQRRFVKGQGIRTKPLPTSVRSWGESAKGIQLKKELRHARAISKPGSTGLEAVGLSRKTLGAMQDAWIKSAREQASRIEREKRAIKRRR